MLLPHHSVGWATRATVVSPRLLKMCVHTLALVIVVMFMYVWVGTPVSGVGVRAGGRKFILWLQNIEDKLRKCCANVQGSAANTHTPNHTHTHSHRFLPLGWAALSPSPSQPSSHEATQPLQPLPNPNSPLGAPCLCVQHLCGTSLTHGCTHIQHIQHRFTAGRSGQRHSGCHGFNILWLWGRSTPPPFQPVIPGVWFWIFYLTERLFWKKYAVVKKKQKPNCTILQKLCDFEVCVRSNNLSITPQMLTSIWNGHKLSVSLSF